MSFNDFWSFLLNSYIQNAGCLRCMLYYERTPCILPVSPKASRCGGNHASFYFTATFPHLFATTRNKKEAVEDPYLNSFFKRCSKLPEPDPQLDEFHSWATAPPLVSFLLALLKCIVGLLQELGNRKTKKILEKKTAISCRE